jgi:hypothetical protein
MRWRWSLLTAGLAYAVVWGPVLLDQRNQGPTFIETTTWSSFVGVLNNLVQDDPALTWLVCSTNVAGGVALACNHRVLFRVWLCLFVAPAVAAALIGVKQPILQTRMLAAFSWGVPVAFGAFVEAALRMRRAVGVAVITLALVFVLPATRRELQRHDPADSTAAIDYVRSAAGDGDAVAIRPQFLFTETHWYLGGRRQGPTAMVDIGIPDMDSFVLGPGPWTGRVWLIEATEHNDPTPTNRQCAEPVVVDGHRVWCLES